MLLKIAFRNVFRQKRRTLLTALTMTGGFVLAAVSIGWSDGSYSHIIEMFTRNRLGHIQLHRKGYLDRPSIQLTIDHYGGVLDTLRSLPDVEACAPRLFAAGLVSVGERSAGARITGVDPAAEDETTRFNRKVERGRPFEDPLASEALIGEGLARRLEAQQGDELVVVSQAADGSIANDAYRVVGIVKTDDPATDQTTIYLPLGAAQNLFVLDGRVHEIAVVGRSLGNVPALARTIRESLGDPGIVVETWQEFARSFYLAMKADVEGMWITLLVILLVVAVGVLNTVLMSTLERSKEYGLLRALGTGPGWIVRLVLLEVTLLALFSSGLGSVLGWAANYTLSLHGISLPTTLTYGGVEFGTMYAEVNLRSFVLPAVSVIVSAIVVALLPALRAAHTEPARTMRMH
jgi:putative ABC transport system permease protein